MTHALLCTENSYPFGLGGISTWCDQLIRGLADCNYHFTVYALHHSPAPWAFHLPENVLAVETVDTGRYPIQSTPLSTTEAGFNLALEQLLVGCRSSLPDFAAGLADLAKLGARTSLWDLFTSRSTIRVLTDGLRQLGGAPVAHAEVRQTARWLRDQLVPVFRVPPRADLMIATSAGLGAVPAWLASRDHGVPFVLVEHGVALREALLALQATAAGPAFRLLQATFHEMLTRLLLRDAARVITVCRFNTEWEARLGADMNRTQIIYNGINPAEHPDLTGHVNAVPTIGWIGRIDPLKGLGNLIDAFSLVVRAVPRAHLLLFGPTPPGNSAYRHELEARIQALNLCRHVTFEGAAAPVQHALESSDVIALPSLSEGLPYVLLEAMMSGRAVVAHRVGGIPEALGETGYLIEPHDTPALARGLEELLCSPARRTAVGSQARQRAQTHFTERTMLCQYRQAFALAMSGARA